MEYLNLKNDASGVKIGHSVPEQTGVERGLVTCLGGHVPLCHWSGACQALSCLKQNRGCLENGAATIAAVLVVGCLDGLSPPGLAPNRYRITIGPRSSQSCGHLPISSSSPTPFLIFIPIQIFKSPQKTCTISVIHLSDCCESNTSNIL